MGNNGTIRVLTNHDREFYRDVGPFLSRRDIVTELGFPVWDDDGKAWYVMYQGETVVGFVATGARGRYTTMRKDRSDAA